jgi:hypothetical protein
MAHDPKMHYDRVRKNQPNERFSNWADISRFFPPARPVGKQMTIEFWPDKEYADIFLPDGECLRVVEDINGIPLTLFLTSRPVLIDLFLMNHVETGKDVSELTIQHDFGDGDPVVNKPGTDWANYSAHLFPSEGGYYLGAN